MMLGPRLHFLSFILLSLQICGAVNVYLNPPRGSRRPTVSPEEASSVVSQHLGLEMFESSPSRQDFSAMPFVGQGSKSSVILSLEETDAQAILPPSLRPSFKISTSASIDSESMSSVLASYVSRAQHMFHIVEDIQLPSWQLTDPLYFSSLNELLVEPGFISFDLSSISQLRENSEDYSRAVDLARKFVEQALNRAEDVHTAILVYTPSPSQARRQTGPRQSQVPLPPDRAPPQSPIGSISTCFSSEDACNNSTSTCSGRGQCVSASKGGRTCFVCTCAATKTGEGNKVKTQNWVGESCEREDVSGPFVLLIGTIIGIIAIVVGSVSLLYSVGEADLPNTLMGTAVIVKRD